MSAFPQAQTIQITDIDGEQIDLEVFSAGSGRPLVLCHGWPEHAYSWRHQIQPLVDAGYHVIAPNQRGYGASSRPDAVQAYDIAHLTGDLVALLDHFGYDQATFVGHDWGAIVVWNMGLMHPQRVSGIINLSVPFMERGATEWVEFWESMLGPDFYIVHFNRQPGVADQAFADNCQQFLGNLYRTRQWLAPPQSPQPGMALINLANSTEPTGDALMSEAELGVFVDAFKHAGFTGGINWYRNFTRNWSLLAEYEQRIQCPALMIYGQYDMVPPSDNLGQFVAELEVVTLPCGHWIQQEEPAATTHSMLDWLARNYPASP